MPTVLLIEDNEQNRYLATFLLERNGYIVVAAHDGPAGVTRALVLDIARGMGLRHREETVRAADLLSADEVFITSTLKECCPVRAIDGRPVGPVQPGPITLDILRRYRENARRA